MGFGDIDPSDNERSIGYSRFDPSDGLKKREKVRRNKEKTEEKRSKNIYVKKLINKEDLLKNMKK